MKKPASLKAKHGNQVSTIIMALSMLTLYCSNLPFQPHRAAIDKQDMSLAKAADALSGGAFLPDQMIPCTR